MEEKGKINKYICEVCGESIVTVNRDDGVTPMYLACRVNQDGMSVSQWYHVSQDLTPTYEWYKPEPDEYLTLDADTIEHLKLGGLLIRKIGGQKD